MREVEVGQRRIPLDPNNKHDQAYLNFCEGRPVTINVALDEWVSRRFVKPGDVILDGGANIGFTSYLYERAGASRVLAVEPVRANFERLGLWASDVIRPHHCALFREDGEKLITLSQTHHQGSTLCEKTLQRHRHIFGDLPQQETVACRAIDSLFKDESFDFVKFDLEGAELDALMGATTVFGRSSPRVLQAELERGFFDDFWEVAQAHFDFALRICWEEASGFHLRCLGDPLPEQAEQNPVYLFLR